MKITVLPEELQTDHDSPIQLFYYNTYSDFHRGKIKLSLNTISFLVHGTKEVIGDNQSIKIDVDEFLIMKAGNCLMTEKMSSEHHVYKSILLFFSDEMIVDFLEKNKQNIRLKEASDSFYVFSYDNYIKHYVSSLEKISTLAPSLQRRLLPAKFEEIMLYLVHQNGASFLQGILRQNTGIDQRLISIVENNKLSKLSLQELSFLSNMSLSSFKRAFAKQYGESPIKWFQARRLEHAAFVLRSQHKRPIDIFEEAGYESYSNFVQAFKKQYGITPKQYQLKN